MAIDKSKWNLNVKVSQKTIDEIKKMGMTKALKTASGSAAAARNNSDASAKEWNEGLRRLYGADRVGAMSNTTGGPKSANTKAPLRKPAGAYTKGTTKSGSTVATGAKSSTKSTPAKSTLANYNKDTNKLPNNMSTAGKSQKQSGLTPQKVAGTALTIAGILATRGKVRNAGSALSVIKGAKVSPSTLAKGVKATEDSVKVGAKGSFGKTSSLAAKATAKKTAAAKPAAKPAAKTVAKPTVKKTAAKTTDKTVGKSRVVKGGFYKGMIATTTKTKNGTTTKYTKPKGGKK